MAQVKPALTLDVSLGSSNLNGIGGSGTSSTPRAHQNAVNNKIQNQIHASTFGPQSDYQTNADHAYAHDDFDQQPDNGGFSSDDDAQDGYAAATSRLKAGSSSAGAKATRDGAHPATQAQYQQQQHSNRISDGAEYDQYDGADEYGHDEYAQGGHYQHHQMGDGMHDEMIYEDEEEGDEIEDDESDLSSSPSIPDENIDFDLVYALHNFVATVEGQATVHKGNSLTLLDDSNSYWWLVRVLRTQEVGYIPAENIETPFERLARLNKHRNVDLTSATDDDHIQVPERIFTSHLVKARNASGTAGLSLHSGKLSALSRHDGMEWDGQEAERVQQQHQDAMRANANATQEPPSRSSIQQQATEAAQQLVSHPYAQQSARSAAGPSQGPTAQLQRASGAPTTEQPPSQHQQQQQQLAPQEPTTNGSGPSSTSSQQAKYGALGSGHVPGEHIRTTSAERSISSINSSGSLAYDAAGLPTSTGMGRNSLSSSGGFLPSQIQRERANSDASASSTVIAGDSASSSDRDKRKSNRTSKGSDSYDANEEKAGKKRSGVFSLFSRKDKKDRKSGTFEDREGMGGISSEDGFVPSARGHGNPAVTVNPAVQAANANLQPGQSIGMGRAVQERDRATQEAFQKQYLSPQSNSFDSSQVTPLASPRLQQRPGSLVGPSGSTPMLSVLRVFAGEGVDSDSTFKTVLLNESTRSIDLQRQVLQRFGVDLHDMNKYVLTIKRLEGDERPLDEDEHPLQLFNTLTEILQQGQVTVPSVKRSSVGSISSISSNLSTHPAIARLGNDFSDDHAVKFYISRRDRLQGYVDLNGSHTADESGRSGNVSDLSVSQDNSNLTSLSMIGEDAARSSHSSVSGETNETVQSPTARFALRLIIYSSDLPDGIVFDPQSNALVPAATLRERLSRRPEGTAEPTPQHRFREKILTFPRNTTVAEVVEEGLDRFGIAEGVVEGGDDVEDRPSRRKSRLHVKYGLAVQAADGERALAATSKVLEAYPAPPAFKLGIGNRRSVDGKRRSIDAAALLGASDDIGIHDPVFVLRQITHAHPGPKARQQLGHTVGARAHSPTDNALAAVQDTRQTQAQATSPRLEGSRDAKPSQGRTPQEIIAAQRAAAAERNAAVLGAQRNAQQGVDVVLSNQARIRSTKLGPSNKFRYSYVPVDGQERDISSIVEDVMKDEMQSSNDTQASSYGDRGLSPRDARPAFGTKRSMQSDFTSTDDYASARSSPLSVDDANRMAQSPISEYEGNVTPLQRTTGGGEADGDLLDTLLRSKAPSNTNAEERISERINAVLDRVEMPASSLSSAAAMQKSGSAASSTRALTPTVAQSTSADAQTSQQQKTSPATVAAGVAAAAAGAAIVGTGAGVVAAAVGAVAAAAAVHQKQPSTGSELSNSRDTSSPLTVGTSSAGTNATNTTQLTPMSTLIPTVPAPRQPVNTAMLRTTSALSAASAGGRDGSRSITPSAYPSVAALSFGADDASLSHLYTIVDAAARRDPRRKLLTHASMSSISSAPSPILNSAALFSAGSGSAGSRPGSKLSHAASRSLLLEDDKDSFKPEPGNLFAPNMPFVEDRKLREAYSGINRQLGDIDDSLDSLLADVIRIF
uniref:SH3 domain-containing protein n=1 Tax=Kalmanozyma brasiliensis (strain GHG001) TaxID=1365824 RepID=V5GK81_KALBG